MLTQSRRKIGKRYHRPGTAPGTLVPLDGTSGPVRIRVLDYGPDRFAELEPATIEEVFPYRDAPTVTWINIDGLQRRAAAGKAGPALRFPPPHSGGRPQLRPAPQVGGLR